MGTFETTLFCLVAVYTLCLFLTATLLKGDKRARVCFSIVGISILGVLYELVYTQHLDGLSQMEKFLAGTVAVLTIACYSALGIYDKVSKIKANAIYKGENMLELKDRLDASEQKKLELDQQTYNQVMAWITDTIINFDEDERKSILSCADIFVKTGAIAKPSIPIKYNEYYTQTKLREIGGVLFLLHNDRVDCANFLLTVFSDFFTRGNKTELSTNKKKMPGVDAAKVLLSKNHVQSNRFK